MDQHPLISKAIEICGSQPALAERLGCRQQTVSKMLNLEIPVSAEFALLTEHATGGQVPAREIRPDLPWPAISSPSTSDLEQQQDDGADGGAEQHPALKTAEVAS